jgi:hypothetical protein
MRRDQETTPYYVPAYSGTQQAQPQRMEARPSWEGRSDVGRLLVFVALGIAAGVIAYFVVEIDRLPALLLGLLLVVLLWLVDNLFSTGYLHKQAEQRTEQMRIRAAMMDAAAVNEAQDEAMQLLWQEIQKLHQRLDAMDTFTVSDGRTVRQVHKADTADLRIRQWLTTDVFNANGAMVGVHPNGQLKRAVPFKESAATDEDKAAYRRLVAAGLLGRSGNNYVWVGPSTLPLALDKLARLGVQTDE